jgi:hypothetical protein
MIYKIFMSILFAIIFSTAIKGDVVLGSSLGRLSSETQGKVINYSNGTRYDNGVGLVFTTGSSDSGSWYLNSIKMSFTTFGSYSGGTVTFRLYYMANNSRPLNTGNPADGLYDIRQSKSVNLQSFSYGTQLPGTERTFDLSGLSVYANQQYFLGINISGNINAGPPNGYLQINSYPTGLGGHAPVAQNQSGWQVPSTYSYMQSHPNDTVSRTFDASTTNVNYTYVSGGIGFELDATTAAVPEPASIFLFSFALLITATICIFKKIKQKYRKNNVVMNF